MPFKVNCSRSEGESGSYDLSYGKGSHKLTAKLTRLQNGDFQSPTGTTGMKRELIAEWGRWAEKAYAGNNGVEADDVPGQMTIEDVGTGLDVVPGVVKGPPSHKSKGPPPKPPVVKAPEAALRFSGTATIKVSEPLSGGICIVFSTANEESVTINIDCKLAKQLACLLWSFDKVENAE